MRGQSDIAVVPKLSFLINIFFFHDTVFPVPNDKQQSQIVIYNHLLFTLLVIVNKLLSFP